MWKFKLISNLNNNNNNNNMNNNINHNNHRIIYNKNKIHKV